MFPSFDEGPAYRTSTACSVLVGFATSTKSGGDCVNPPLAGMMEETSDVTSLYRCPHSPLFGHRRRPPLRLNLHMVACPCPCLCPCRGLPAVPEELPVACIDPSRGAC